MYSLLIFSSANTPPSFVSLTEIHGELGQPSVRDNTTLLVRNGYNYTYRVIFFDPDETDNVTITLKDDVLGAFIEDGKKLRKKIWKIWGLGEFGHSKYLYRKSFRKIALINEVVSDFNWACHRITVMWVNASVCYCWCLICWIRDLWIFMTQSLPHINKDFPGPIWN